jgi:glycogen operon protein
MLSGGDEIGRTQRGNNNAYCEDNELSWHDWNLDGRRKALLAFTRRLIGLRRRHPVLRRKLFFYGRAIYSDIKDLTWFRPDGREMTETDWQNAGTRAFGLRLAGDTIEEVDDRGERIVDDTFLILINGFWEPLPFVLPAHKSGVRWELLLDTRETEVSRRGRALRGGQTCDMEARSLAAFRQA